MNCDPQEGHLKKVPDLRVICVLIRVIPFHTINYYGVHELC